MKQFIKKHPIVTTIVSVIATFVIANKLMSLAMSGQSFGNQLMVMFMLNSSMLAMSPHVGIILQRHFSKVPEMHDKRFDPHILVNKVFIAVGIVAIIITPFLKNDTQNNLLISMILFYPALTYVAVMVYAEKLKQFANELAHE